MNQGTKAVVSSIGKMRWLNAARRSPYLGPLHPRVQDDAVSLLKMSPLSRSPHTHGRWISLLLAAAVVSAVLVGLHGAPPPPAGGSSAATVCSLDALLTPPPEYVAPVDLAGMSLLCAEGLPGAGSFDLAKHLKTVDGWAERVKTETERHPIGICEILRNFRVAVVLGEDYGMHYKHEGRTAPAEASTHDGFFTNGADVFLPGLLGPKRQGTCSLLPVSYVAVGRRLGYPLKLEATKGHLFVRWEDARERFNFEGAGQGLNRFEDAYYRQWPFKVTEEEVRAEGYLKSLSPGEELAVFLSIRGMCLRESGRRAEAAESFEAASRLAPGCRSYRLMGADLQRPASGPSRPAEVSTMDNQRKD